MFENTTSAPADLMFELKTRADSDESVEKVDLGVGIYRNEQGNYHELACVEKAKKRLVANDLGHDYELTTGNAIFLRNATDILFGDKCQALTEQRIASVQTISGTGANHLGALLISRTSRPSVYIGTPTWGNYNPLFQLVGLNVVQYRCYDSLQRCVDFDSIIQAVQSAPRGSIFVLQGCCHNPTGADFTPKQWQVLAQRMKAAGQIPFFDIAYQGLGDGLDEDAYGIRLFTSMNFEMLVCQSFSKNFALYSERVGALHVVCASKQIAANVRDQLRSLIRWEFSSSPAFGSRLVNIVYADKELADQWQSELADIRERLQANRARLFESLIALNTPGDWTHILREKGLFSYLRLNAQQCRILLEQYHIYLPSNGRINIAGLSLENTQKVAQAINDVVLQSSHIPQEQKVISLRL